MKIHEGQMNADGLKIGIVVSRFNELITERLLEGALSVWRRHGGNEEAAEVARVPGAFEMPLVAKTMAAGGRFDAIICLGCVIRGATDHYDYVCSQAAGGIMRCAILHRVCHSSSLHTSIQMVRIYAWSILWKSFDLFYGWRAPFL